MNPKLELTDTVDASARKSLYSGLATHNRRTVEPPELRQLCVLLREADGSPVAGGFLAATAWSHLRIEAVFVPERLRCSGAGTRMVVMAEEEARARGCIGAWLDTYRYQAPRYYERLGYIVLGQFDDYPPGHTRVSMKKDLMQ